MPIVPQPQRVFTEDPDVCPTTPFGPGREWPATYEMTHGVGELRDVTPEYGFDYYEETIHFHPGPLGFVPVDTAPRLPRRGRTKKLVKG